MTFNQIANDLDKHNIGGWALKLELADECAWSAELRITTDSSVNEGRCDLSTVFFSGGHADPLSAANEVYIDARKTFWAGEVKP